MLLNFSDLHFEKLAEGNKIFQEIMHESVFHLKNLVDSPEDVKHIPCKLKMGVD